MGLWTEEEYQRTANSTKLSKKTVAACRSVLVDGLSNTEAATLHGVMTQHISRSLKALRDRQAEMVKTVESMSVSRDTLRAYALQEAKAVAVAAGRWEVEDAQPGRSYEGPVIMQTPGFMVQRMVRTLVIHDLGKFREPPNISDNLKIDYPEDGGLAVVSENKPEPEKKTEPEKKPGRGPGGVGR